MGNSQSAEADSAAPFSQVDPGENFNIDEVPDDREPIAQNARPITDLRSNLDANRTQGPNEPAYMAKHAHLPKKSKPPRSPKQSKQKKPTERIRERKRRRTSQNTSNDASSDVLSPNSPLANNPTAAQNSSQPLREIEPETFHDYVFSDGSDREDGASRRRNATTNGFTAVNGSDRLVSTGDQDASANETGSEKEHEASEHARSPHPATETEALDVLASVAARQPAFGTATSQTSTKITEPETDDLGRYTCPLADVEGCGKTFGSRKEAIKHMKVHTRTASGADQATSADSSATTRVTTIVNGTTSASTAQFPEPEVNSEGRFLCPLLDRGGCGKTFKDKQTAMRHAKLHTSDFVCTICNKQLSRQDSLDKHMQKHTDLETATVTNTSADRAQGQHEEEQRLKKAAITHAMARVSDLTCPVCQKQLSRRDKLMNHMKQHSSTEITAASQINAHAPEEQNEEEQQLGKDPQEAEIEIDQALEEDSAEFATPHDLSPESAQPNSVEKILQGAQEMIDSEMVEVDAVDETDGKAHIGEVDVGEEPDAANNVSEGSSERQSTAPSSVSEGEETVVKETPMLTGRLQRKRMRQPTPEDVPEHLERTRKRKRISPSSPPTSFTAIDVTGPRTPKAAIVTENARSRQITDEIVPRLQSRQASMDGWAQKFTPGSNLKHPMLNPTPPRLSTQRIEVVIPRTSQAGPSGTKSRGQRTSTDVPMTAHDHDSSEADSSARTRHKKPWQAPYTTPKGKKRAQSGVDYTTPAKEAEIEEAVASEEETSPVNLATSVARRTFPDQNQQEMQSREDSEDLESNPSAAPESEAETSEVARPSKKAKAVPRKQEKQRVKRNEQPTGSEDRVECTTCHRFFVSESHLRRHQKKRSAHVGLLKCHDCAEQFYASAALARHEKDTGHGKGNGSQGRTGAFSPAEVNRINKWRNQFCDYHDISTSEFNDMMTATLERSKAANWRYGFVTRAEFLKEYVSVLPNRNKRSMLRYRERNFQNLEGMKNWTAEDDADLVRLRKELGPRWAEIARRLGRTFDAVSQRWRHKLQYSQVQTGEWSKAENAEFKKILEKLGHDSTGSELESHAIPWNKVSERLGSRSAQQCSNHYRSLHSKKERGKWVKIGESTQTPGSRQTMTPSKMERRLNGEKVGGGTSRKGLSEEYIRDESEGDDEAEAAEDEDVDGNDDADDQAELVEDEDETVDEDGDEAGGQTTVPQGEVSDAELERSETHSPFPEESSATKPTRKRNPLQAKTPGKTLRSSQLFEQTQANTSALKPSQQSNRKGRGQPSQDRPSPHVLIQRERNSSRSPLKEIDERQDTISDGEGEGMRRQKSSQELSTIHEARKGEEESDADEHGTERNTATSPRDSGDDDEAVKAATDDENVEAADDDRVGEDGVTTKEDSDAEEELVNGEEEQSITETDDEETQSTDGSEAQSAASHEALSEPEDEDEYEDVAEQPEQPTSSFMDSIQASAKRANIKKVRSGSQSQRQTLMGLPVPEGRGRRDIWQQASDEYSD